MNMLHKLSYRKLGIVIVVFFVAMFFYSSNPTVIETAPLTAASATLGNSRLSYKAGVFTTYSTGASTIDIDTSGNPDVDTDHLFPDDTICFSDSGENGCVGDTSYVVNTVPDGANGDTFTLDSGLTAGISATDLVIASQSGSLTLTFTTATEIPSDGNILITIPAIDHATKPCDGIPDHSSATTTNGFDLGPSTNRVAAGDISVTAGCTPANWSTTETVTCGNAVTDHTIEITRTTSVCAAGSTITVAIDSDPGIINPAPITSGHTQGTSDTYIVNVKTRDAADTVLDNTDVQIAPIEGVYVSAVVDETLSFSIAGVSADSGSYCGITRTGTSPDTTATTVPFGTVSDADDFTDTNQLLTVSTNSDGGYTLYAEEDDELGLDGANSPFIPDTTCDGAACTHVTPGDWNTATIYGFGYSLQNVSGTDAQFEYNDSGTFYSKSFANQTTGDARDDSGAEIMSNAGPVSGSSAYVCYRLNVSGVQEAGTYFNKVKYTAVPSF